MHKPNKFRIRTVLTTQYHTKLRIGDLREAVVEHSNLLIQLSRRFALSLNDRRGSFGDEVLVGELGVDAVELLLSGGELVGDGSPEELFSDVERMRSLHLGVSRSREIAWLLKKGGMDIPQDICSYDRLLPAVLAHLRGGDEHD